MMPRPPVFCKRHCQLVVAYCCYYCWRRPSHGMHHAVLPVDCCFFQTFLVLPVIAYSCCQCCPCSGNRQLLPMALRQRDASVCWLCMALLFRCLCLIYVITAYWNAGLLLVFIAAKMVLPVAAMLLPLLLSRVAKHRCFQHHSVAADSNDCFLHATATIFLLLAWLLRLAPVGYCGWPQLAIVAGPSWLLQLAGWLLLAICTVLCISFSTIDTIIFLVILVLLSCFLMLSLLLLSLFVALAFIVIVIVGHCSCQCHCRS